MAYATQSYCWNASTYNTMHSVLGLIHNQHSPIATAHALTNPIDPTDPVICLGIIILAAHIRRRGGRNAGNYVVFTYETSNEHYPIVPAHAVTNPTDPVMSARMRWRGGRNAGDYVVL